MKLTKYEHQKARIEVKAAIRKVTFMNIALSQYYSVSVPSTSLLSSSLLVGTGPHVQDSTLSASPTLIEVYRQHQVALVPLGAMQTESSPLSSSLILQFWVEAIRKRRERKNTYFIQI